MGNEKPKFRRHADGQVSVYIGDGFANFINGLGHGNLKSSGATYRMDFEPHELETAYRTSTWFGKIVDIPADDSTREWRSWKLKDGDVQKIEIEESRLGLKAKVRQARIWQRLYGGAALIVGAEGSPPDQELIPEKVGVGGLKFVTVVTKEELRVSQLRKNPLDPYYGLPEFFEVRTDSGTIQIHPSRVIPFRGVQISPTSAFNNFWGDPVWVRLEDAIKGADSAGAVINALLQEAKVDVLRVSGMMKGMATAEYESLMLRRFSMVAVLKGMQNVMLLDKDDEWEQKQIQWSGVPEVAKHLLNILSGAANIPMFRLTGQNLTGLNSTGDAETRAYYDDVRSDQNTDMRPTLDPLDQFLVRSALGDYPEGLWYEWNSLYQMTDKEKAEIDKIEADTVSIINSTGLIPSEALAKAVQTRMIDSGRWSGLEQALEEAPEDDGEDDKQLAEMVKLISSINPPANQKEEPQRVARAVGDAEPRPLYVRRDVLNWEEIAAHYKAQGFKTTLGKEMHVTVVYSTAPVDWMKVGASWEAELKLPAGGPRIMEAFGPNGEAKVLTFASSELQWRHEAAREAGASWSHDSYQPHITISYDAPRGLDLDNVKPWVGEIQLGPEIFEPIKDDWKAGLKEDSDE